MSRVREFEVVSMVHGEQRVAGIRMTCGKCGHCEEKPRGSSKTFVGPQEEAQRFTAMFTREGWFVGKRAQEDRCPKCATALGIERPKTPTPPKNTVMEAKLKEAIAAHQAPKAAAQPREMTREDGRLIFAKLEEVYRDEKHGYQNGWSDHKVATDMGVPRAWVEDVRKKFFGPEGSNDDVRQVAEQARAHLALASHLITEARALLSQAQDLATKGETIQRRIDHIEQVVGR